MLSLRRDVLDYLMPFQLESNYQPRGDQGQAIAKLANSLQAGNRHQTLLGVTAVSYTHLTLPTICSV